MKYTDMLVENVKPKMKKVPLEEALTPEEILRSKDFKIKLVTGTAFGTQIEFAKKYPDEELQKVLKDFKIKIKNKSVFIVD